MALSHVSPSYEHTKLESPSYSDLVDVFEDRMRKWLLEPAQHLLSMEYGDVPAISLTLGYFEGIEIYFSGQDSDRTSKEFFRRGFQRVFQPRPESAHIFDETVNGLYVQARCGFSHDGLFRNRVFFSDGRPEALTITWPKKDGEFVKTSQIESIVINAKRFVDGVVRHFEQYVADLRSEEDETLKANFLKVVELKWGLNEPPRFIGMTENEFFGKEK